MIWDIIEAKQKRYALCEQQKALHCKAAGENRALTAEEQTEWDRRDADIIRMTAEIERYEGLLKIKDDESAKRGITESNPVKKAHKRKSMTNIARLSAIGLVSALILLLLNTGHLCSLNLSQAKVGNLALLQAQQVDS